MNCTYIYVSTDVIFLPIVNDASVIKNYMEKRRIVKEIVDCFERDGKLIIFGNGGSMAEASHMAAEFIGLGLPAISLSDPSVITALSNDYGYNNVFDFWVKAIGKDGDLAIGISSSGKSKNVNRALRHAKFWDIDIIDFPRKGKTTSEVQDNQLKLIHQIYEEFK